MKLPFMDTLGSVGLVGERKALALLFLGFYTTLFFMIGLSALHEAASCALHGSTSCGSARRERYAPLSR